MHFPAPKIKSSAVRQLPLLLFWPVFGILFYIAEHHHPAEHYYTMYLPIDDYIPFAEIFVIPYVFWFVYLFSIHVYTFFYEPSAFKKLMYFIMLTYGAALLLFFLFPTCQMLRPEGFLRDNILTRFMTHFYAFDTSTNVCPSLHVVGALAVSCTAKHCRGLQTRFCRLFFPITTALICLSTVFLKQHSTADVLAALPICLIAYRVCFF